MLVLRDFREGDFDAIRAWAPTPDDVYLFAGSARLWPLDDAVLREWLHAEKVTPWTAVHPDARDTPVGHIELVSTGETTGRLARVLLDPGVRGKGYGRALVAAAVDAAVASGTTTIDLNVISGNVPAIATYRSLGFVALGPNPEHPDMTRMRLRL